MAFDIEAHRGGRALMPENTLASFANALSMGVDTLELDIGVTADGALVVSHERGLNPDLARGPDGAWVAAPGIPFVRLPLAEIKKYDVGRIRPDSAYAKQFPDQHAVPGTPIPTLSEVFALVRKSGERPCALQHRNQDRSQPPRQIPRAAAFCHAAARSRGRREIRGPHHGAVVRLAHVAARTKTRACDYPRSISPCRRATRRRCRCKATEWTAGFDPAAHGGSLPRTIKDAGGAIWSPYFGDVTPELIAESHGLGLKIVVWTVNRKDDIARLIDAGVDGIISDTAPLISCARSRRKGHRAAEGISGDAVMEMMPSTPAS